MGFGDQFVIVIVFILVYGVVFVGLQGQVVGCVLCIGSSGNGQDSKGGSEDFYG